MYYFDLKITHKNETGIITTPITKRGDKKIIKILSNIFSPEIMSPASSYHSLTFDGQLSSI